MTVTWSSALTADKVPLLTPHLLSRPEAVNKIMFFLLLFVLALLLPSSSKTSLWGSVVRLVSAPMCSFSGSFRSSSDLCGCCAEVGFNYKVHCGLGCRGTGGRSLELCNRTCLLEFRWMKLKTKIYSLLYLPNQSYKCKI